MSWDSIATVTPQTEWTPISFVRSRLVRFTYTGDTAWLEKFNVRAYIRVQIANDGVSAKWLTIWPKTENKEIILLSTIPIDSNFLEIRKRRDPYSRNANYTVSVEEYLAEPYLIQYSNHVPVGAEN